jgi:ADP-dependent NAD(P)H-hydrate dehydratase / NAD(P)H-hydrate epimerase
LKADVAMIKILNSQQIKALDAYTIEQEPIPSIKLMERACHAFVTWFMEKFDTTNSVGIVCGTGNNGGDGLGIARLLNEWGYTVKVWIVRGSATETEDFKKNLSRITDKIETFEISTAADQGLFTNCAIIIDAIFGSGLSRPPEGIYAQAINCMNKTKAVRIAVDIPSGLMIDSHSTEPIVRAHHTITFQLPKLAFLLPENHSYVGKWHTVDIGLSKSYLKEVDSNHFYVTNKAVKKKLKQLSKFDHKGDNGKAILVAGSYGKMGACILAAKACLRSGIGLLTVHVPQLGNVIVQTSVPEAMTLIDADETHFTGFTDLNGFDVIGIGPGIGMESQTIDAFKRVLELGKPMIIDADGLNILSAHPNLLTKIPGGSILTPHSKEFERLVGKWENDFERLEKQQQLSSSTKTIIVLKGAHTSITSPDGKVYFNSTGNPGMAKGGSGDVLTGILTGLLAQHYSALDAAVLGVFVHGLAGDLAAREKGMNSLIASDLIEYLPQAFKSLVS